MGRPLSRDPQPLPHRPTAPPPQTLPQTHRPTAPQTRSSTAPLEPKGHIDPCKGPWHRPQTGFRPLLEEACGDNERLLGKELQKHRLWGLCPEMTPTPHRERRTASQL